MADVEQVHCVIREGCVYKLPPRQSNKGYRAQDWGLDHPMWTGRVKVTSKGARCDIILQDTSGKLFAQAPIIGDTVSKVVEPVTDSSRYFVIRVENEGKHAFIGMGFVERSDAFDFNVALQEYTKSLKKEKQSNEPYVPKHDLKMKEGQTIRINIKAKPKEGGDDEAAPVKKNIPLVSLDPSAFAAAGVSASAIQKPFASLSLGASTPAAPSNNLLDPLAAFSAPVAAAPPPAPAAPAAAANPFGDLFSTPISAPAPPSAGNTNASNNPFGLLDPLSGGDGWGDFAATSSAVKPAATNGSNGNTSKGWAPF